MATNTISTTAGDGELKVTVNEFGEFGSASSAGQALYDPLGDKTSASTTYLSYVALGIIGSDGKTGARTALRNAASSDETFTDVNNSTFTVNGLKFQLKQTTQDLLNISSIRTGSRLDQTYTVTNTTDQAIDFDLVRYVDGDLLFDGSLADGGGKFNQNGQDILFETDLGGIGQADTTFFGITGNGGTIPTINRFELDSYSSLNRTVLNGKAFQDRIVRGDGNSDQFIDSGAEYDVALGLRNMFSLEPGQSNIFTSTTRFGSGDLAQLDISVPTGGVENLPTTTIGTTINVASGFGDLSGIRDYDGFVSVNSGDFTQWLTDSRAASAAFTGEIGNTYTFYSLATDNAGNEQSVASAPRTTTQLVSPNPDPTGTIINGTPQSDELTGTVGDDIINGLGSDDTLEGGSGNDKLFGGAGSDELYGDAGNDTLNGGQGDDGLYGGVGNDILNGDLGNDELVGDAGNDELFGNEGIDGLYGEAGDDILDGGFDNDELFGGDGSDELYGDAGNDTLNGGQGDDGLYGGVGNDILNGDLGNDELVGDAGNDELFGGEGIDALYGEAGDDILDGGLDNDELFGGDGGDELYGDAGNDMLNGDQGDDGLYGGLGNDILNGGLGNDELVGDAGDDELFGNEGIDALYGEAGNDILDGGLDNDELFGGLGNDTLNGGFGDDILWGNGGANIFVINSPNSGLDFIRDFDSSQDKLQISAALFGGGLSATVPFNSDQLITGSGVTSVETASQRFICNTTDGNLYFDADGSGIGGKVLIGNLSNASGLNANNFTVV